MMTVKINIRISTEHTHTHKIRVVTETLGNASFPREIQEQLEMFFGHTKRRAAYSDEGLVASDSWFSHKQQLETLSLSLSWRRILSLGVGGVSADQGDQGGKGPGPRQAIDTTCFVSVCVYMCAGGETEWKKTPPDKNPPQQKKHWPTGFQQPRTTSTTL